MATIIQIPSQFLTGKSIASCNSPRNAEFSGLRASISRTSSNHRSLRIRAVKEKTEEIQTPASAEEVTKKYGLEAGLWKVLSSFLSSI